MKLKQIQSLATSKEVSKILLIRLLQSAHAGEKAAANAYWGHAKSFFVTNKIERNEIFQIYRDELEHRKALFEMLQSLGAKPNFIKEAFMFSIGAIIAFLCLWGGWFIPMYGAGKLESQNIEEYEVAARLAFLAGREDLVEQLLHFAEVEWDHEFYFRTKARSHFLYSYFPKWNLPDEKDLIRKNFENFKAT